MSKRRDSPVSITKTVSQDEDYSSKPDFIYGGPFVKVEKPSPLLNIGTPVASQLQGTFKRSFAYYSLKERLPVILTKVIDYLSREGSKIKSKHNATDQDIMSYIQYITKLKNDLITNKRYDPLTVDTPEAHKWNEWISSSPSQYYFTNTWLFSECYVYRRLREGCELSKSLAKFDPFEDQKDQSFTQSLELMCIVAEKLVTMLPQSEKDKRKADLVSLLKICLWANKCDLSLSMGEQVTFAGNADSKASGPPVIDPFEMIIDFKDKVLVDDSGKIADLIANKSEAMAKYIENATIKVKCSCSRLAAQAGLPVCDPPPPTENQQSPDQQSPPPTEQSAEVQCPSKMTIPQTVMFDIVCDNAGYELFTDLCVAHFLVAQGIVKKVRFHVKNFGWFVSDVTPRDFQYVIKACADAVYSRTIAAPPKPEPADGEAPAPDPPREIKSEALKQLGAAWSKFVEDGTFVVMTDDFWTSPHIYKDMKKYAPALYRRLQFAVAVLFKGDLNYRKLVGEMNWNSTATFESCLQGFIPAPVIALRTVKADLICGLPKGKADQISKIDDKWMEKGDYGVIQCCVKCEPLKVADRPCEAYGEECMGVTCPPPS